MIFDAMDDLRRKGINVKESPYDHPGPSDSAEGGTPLYKMFRNTNGQARAFSFGVEEPEQVFMWFSDKNLRNQLRVNGCVLSVYKVPASAVRKGHFQVAFLKEATVEKRMFEFPVEETDLIKIMCEVE
jgi:hypothetical protein